MGRLKRVVWLLALTLLRIDHASADQYPHLLEITSANFSDSLTVIFKDYDRVLMEFYAHWCPVCKAFQPTYAEIAAHLGSRGSATPRIAVARVDCPDNPDICDKFEIRSYPTMFLGTAAQFSAYELKNVVRIDPSPRSKENTIAAISKELGGVPLDPGTLSSSDSGNGDTTTNSNAKMKSSLGIKNNSGDPSGHLRILKPLNFQQSVDLNDIEGAVVKSWEYLTAPSLLRGMDTRKALEDWIDLLADSHPVERCRLGAENAAEVLISAWPEGNEHAALPAALHDVKICGDTEFNDWTGCKGSLPSSRGYTCALWQLFHTLAARLPENDALSGARWMTAIRGFAKNFFQCSDCARNFVKHASTLAADKVQTKREAVLWMWATHNLVNARLKLEEEEASAGDPEYPKIQWPPEELCPTCSSPTSSSQDNNSVEKSWNEEAVFKFLVNFYSAGGSNNDSTTASNVRGKSGSVKINTAMNGGAIKQGNFYSSWEFAFILVSGIGGGTYFMLKTSGQYNFRKSLNRRMCGILMAIRALVQKETKVTGICLTASHNPAPDNGIKMVEPTGEMLQQRFEPIADEFANAESDEALARLVLEFMEKEGVTDATGTVLIAHDTRPSGPELAEAAAAGVRCVGAEPKFLGLLTTPQLHWAVMRTNQNLPAGEDDYYSVLSSAFLELAGKADPPMTLYVDCANGVGGPKIGSLVPHLEAAGLKLELRNIGEGILNGGCGSDFVQNNRTTPDSFHDIPAGARCCAVDGDADRLVYFSPLPDGNEESGNGDSKSKNVILLDGDKIAALAAGLIKDLVSQLPGNLRTSSVGVVQTAYANGASTRFLKESIDCDVAVTPTGVKFLHEAAHAFDAGIYFEANGHGTVLFKSSFLKALVAVAAENSAAAELLALNNVINAAVGDAVSGILMVEAALRRKKWSLEQWSQLYADLPSRQLKVRVADRSIISTTDAERRVAEPKALQEKIDGLIAGVPGGRSFVRPSGTEDVVRVYAEADSVEEMEKLARSVAKAVHQFAGGVGPEP
ncbi:hypothetical protein Ndes2526B_g03039 [Nannochloris sp. 'desiccata']